jgi:hypothetical protein
MHWIAQSREFAHVARLMIGRLEIVTSPLTILLNPASPFIVVPTEVFKQAMIQFMQNAGTQDF